MNVARRKSALATAMAVMAASCAWADQFFALDPIPAALFSIDNASPTANPGTGIRGGDILRHPGPVIIVPRGNLNLNSPNDELDGLSFARINFSPGAAFVLRFSVNRTAVDGAPPDTQLLLQGFPFNATQQSQLRQAAGDEFISLRRFTRNGPLLNLDAADRGPGPDNNTLSRNEGDAGGVDYSLQPEIGPDQFNPGSQDDLKGGAANPATLLVNGEEPDGGNRGVQQPVFFSVTANSPSLVPLPGPNSGAVLFVDHNPNAPGGEQVYADAAALGISSLDDVADFVIFENGDLVFNRAVDQILFNLSPQSPSVISGMFSAADVLTTRPVVGTPAIFAFAEQLGLNPAADLDMLELALCSNAQACVQDWAIGNQTLPGDMNCDGFVTVADIGGFVLALTDPAAYEAAYPDCNPFVADINGDHQVTVSDIGPFVLLLTGG